MNKRNPYRVIDIKETVASEKYQPVVEEAFIDDDRIKSREGILNESEIVQISQWTAHTDSIKSIQFIAITDEPLVFTASIDKYVHIFNIDGEPRGTLKQGYMMVPDYHWDFPMKAFDAEEMKKTRQS